MTTLDRVKAFLSDPANIAQQYRTLIVRIHFTTANGVTVSIQQSSYHYSDADSVEMWDCPHLPILDEYGNGEKPYGRVPLQVVADYIDQLESKS
jgi:hypothetical protein